VANSIPSSSFFSFPSLSNAFSLLFSLLLYFLRNSKNAAMGSEKHCKPLAKPGGDPQLKLNLQCFSPLNMTCGGNYSFSLVVFLKIN